MFERTQSNEDFSAADPDQKETLEEEPRSILRGIVSQVINGGLDLHRVTLPTFVLEPRSMLERITDFMTHPDFILSTHLKKDPLERMIDVVRYFLSGWHIRPKGVKKPYNPVLGEFFRCTYEYPDGSKAYYVAEQTCHHPPVSSYYFDSPRNGFYILGELRPRSKFLGNSAATIMAGASKLRFTKLNEEYVLGYPNVYARGILFGTMLLELGDNVTVKCAESGLQCDIEFKTKGYIFGTYNAIAGKIRRISASGKKQETLCEIFGKWTDSCCLKPSKSMDAGAVLRLETSLISSTSESPQATPTVESFSKTAKKKEQVSKQSSSSSSGDIPEGSIMLFNVTNARVQNKIVASTESQEPNESRRLWHEVTCAINAKDLDLATKKKTEIEGLQREARRQRDSEKHTFEPRFFISRGKQYACNTDSISPNDKPLSSPVSGTDDQDTQFVFRFSNTLDESDPIKRESQLQTIIFGAPTSPDPTRPRNENAVATGTAETNQV